MQREPFMKTTRMSQCVSDLVEFTSRSAGYLACSVPGAGATLTVVTLTHGAGTITQVHRLGSPPDKEDWGSTGEKELGQGHKAD